METYEYIFYFYSDQGAEGGSKTSSCRNRRAFIYNMYKKGCWYLVASESFGDGVRDLEECSGRVSKESAARTYCRSGRTRTLLAFLFGTKQRGKRDGRVPSQRKGTSQDGGRKRECRGSLAMGRNGPEQREKAGWPGFPRNGKERARKKRRKRDGRGSLAMGRNGPGRKGESGTAGVPLQWEKTGQEEKGESGMAGVPSQWEGTGQGGR
jgi:hypothetical protein